MEIRDHTRRTETGKMFIDVAKYAFTIVVIGGLFAERIHVDVLLLGSTVGAMTLAIGFFLIPLDEPKGKEQEVL